MRVRWKLSPRVSVIAALIIAGVVDGVIWIVHSGDSSPAPAAIPRVRESGPVDLTDQSSHALLVGVGNDVAYFINWSRSGNSVGGDMTEDRISTALDSTFTDTFTATVQHKHVSLNLPGQGLNGARTFTGHLTSRTLVVIAPGEPHGVITFHVEKDLTLYSKAVDLMLARQNAHAGGG